MNLKLKHIIIIMASILLSACAMDNRSMKSSDENIEVAADADIDDIEIDANYEVEPKYNKPLINQKLQDFYDLIALQNQHPEFTDEVAEQLKNYTNESIKSFADNETVIIKNIKQLGDIITVNDSTQKIKITYDKMIKNIKTADTIFAIITNKTILLDDEKFISNKVSFSKN